MMNELHDRICSNKIRIKAIRRNSVYTQKRLGNKSVESSSSNANKKKNTIDFRN